MWYSYISQYWEHIMDIDKNTIIIYIISFIIMLTGFSLIFFTRSTLTLAGSSILVFIGLFLFLIVREKAHRTGAISRN
jgi:hypothetical protein